MSADTRRLNSNRTHRPDCSCPWCRAGKFPHRIEVRLTQEDWDALDAAANSMGMSRAEIVRLGLSRLIASHLAPAAKQRQAERPRMEQGKRLLREGLTRWRVAQLLGVEWTTANYWWKQIRKEEKP